jgi:glycosyltransferase involved in cell wall biosynthesis
MSLLNRPLTIGVILPHTKLFGGVRRFFELGEILERKSHQFIIFTPDGIRPQWFDYSGEVRVINELNQYSFDALFITEMTFLRDLIEANAKMKVVYHVGPRAKLDEALKFEDITVFTNSSNMYDFDKRKYGIRSVKAFGGVHLPLNVKEDFSSEPFVVMAYGRLTRKGKGTALVIKACERLYRKGHRIKLILFDTPIDARSEQLIQNFNCSVPFEFVTHHPVNKNHELFQRADVFVAAEKKGGWCNTGAEALASGVPLVGTKTGTRDFLIHNETGLLVWRHSFFIRRAIEKLINDRMLARRLARNGRATIEQFSWSRLADFIENYIYEGLRNYRHLREQNSSGLKAGEKADRT